MSACGLHTPCGSGYVGLWPPYAFADCFNIYAKIGFSQVLRYQALWVTSPHREQLRSTLPELPNS